MIPGGLIARCKPSTAVPPLAGRVQVRSVERTRVIRLDGGHILAYCEADHTIGYEVIKRVSQILIERLHTAVGLKGA